MEFDVEAMSAIGLSALKNAITSEEERRATMHTAEQDAADLAVRYVEAGGMLDVLIEAMCNGLEEAAAQRN